MTYPTEFSKAILSVIFVADKVNQGIHDFVPTVEISSSLAIPKPTVAKLLRSLAAAGIIETREGVKGGVRLLKPAHEVTILDVLLATSSGRPLFQTDFGIRATGRRPTRVQASIVRVFNAAEDAMQAELSKTTIGEVLQSVDR